MIRLHALAWCYSDRQSRSGVLGSIKITVLYRRQELYDELLMLVLRAQLKDQKSADSRGVWMILVAAESTWPSTPRHFQNGQCNCYRDHSASEPWQLES